MAEEKKRLTAVERAELALAEAKAKAEEKNKLKRKAALVELARRRQAMQNAGVKVTARGDLTVAAIVIKPEVVDITRLDKLERTILDNVNRALKKAKDDASAQMQKMTKEMGLDGLLGG